MRTTVVVSAVLGDVTIAGLRMSQRFSMSETADKGSAYLITELLHFCVVDGEGKPLKSADEWDIFAGDNQADALFLFKECKAFNDVTGKQAEKK